MVNILSFDIEEWFTYENLSSDKNSEKRLEGYLDLIFELLSDKIISATFFVLGSIARSHPDIITKISNAGHEVACHSDVHKWLTDFSPNQFEEDTKRAISSIENVTGKKVKSYRAPAFSITPSNKWAFEILKQYGIEYDCSIFPAGRDFGGFDNYEKDVPSIVSYNGVEMKELPMGIATILNKKIAYSGGGYFRLLPYSTIKKIISSRDYNMTYFHLRDFDVQQKRKMNLRYFKNYYGINGSMDKFKILINDFEFINVENAARIIDWDTVPVVEI
jgi:polysaccharide deacetylase family protein (PEP-CTERM system associated)